MTKNTLKINKIYLSGYMYWSAGADNLFQTFEWNSFVNLIENTVTSDLDCLQDFW